MSRILFLFAAMCFAATAQQQCVSSNGTTGFFPDGMNSTNGTGCVPVQREMEGWRSTVSKCFRPFGAGIFKA
jgi:hypothetical protein